MGERSELKEIQKLEGHTGKVWSVAWNPVAGTTDGTPAILASCSSDGTVRIWRQNPTTSAFECMATIRGAQIGTVRSCSWSPDGNSLAIANYDGTTSIWDKIENDFKHLCDLKGHEKEVVSVSWNTSGHIATCSSNSVWIWELGEYEECETLEEFYHTEDVEMVQWHPVDDILFSCGCDKIIKVWERYSDDKHWHFTQDLDGHLSKVCSISFDATGDKMVTSSADLSIKVWGHAERMQSRGDYQPWELLYTLPGYHKRTIFSVHWSSEGIIASGAADGSICLFEENRDGLSLERRGAMYKLLLTKEKAHDTNVNLVQWAPKSQERSQATHELLLKKGKAHETDVNSVRQGPKERSECEAMRELLLTKEKPHETNVNLVQQGPKETNKAMYKLLLTKEKANEMEVTAVQWAPKVNSPKVTGKKRSYENSVQWAPKERSEAMHESLLKKEKAHETDVKSFQQVPKLQERSEAMHGSLLIKEKAHEMDVKSLQQFPKSQDRSETMHESLLTKEKAHETDVRSSQQVPKLQERNNEMCKLLLTREKANETEVTAVQWAPEEVGLFASSSDDGTVKIWKFTSRQ